ncbi:efflux RND transporter periplasmic adaptor subunit [Clostridium sporogenes]|uniref:efflux RND transporter periplasmic adaptor subunit n=1 Tax=Clostridium sporogenes TaxID=1509 RepID=UPI003DA5904D
MKNKGIISVSLIMVAVLSLLGFIVVSSNKSNVNINGNINKKVTLYTVNGPQNIFFDGEIKSCKRVVIQADTTKGIVDKINVEDKQNIKAGDILFSYKNNDLIEQRIDLEYQLEDLKNKYNRTKKKLDSISNKGQQQKVLAQQSKDELQDELNDNIKEQNHLNEKINNINNKCNVSMKAPFDGVVTMGGYSEIEPSKPILTLDSKDMQVVCEVSEKNILKLTEDQTVKVSILGTGQCINGKIKNIDNNNISPEVSMPKGGIQQGIGAQNSSNNLSTVNSYEVIIQIDNIKNIYPGFHVQVSTKDNNYTPKVPRTSIFKNNGKSYIWVVKNGILKKKEVEVDDWNDKYVQVKNGGNFNDKVVREANDTMKEGDKIE